MKPKPAGHLRLVSWNVNGLRAVLQKGFCDFLVESEADVVCVQEIKARPEQVAGTVWPEGWQIAWNPARRPGYSGVAIFSKVGLPEVEAGIGEEEHDGEGRVLSVRFPGFCLVNVYTPNSQRELGRLKYRTEEWEPAFLRWLEEKKRGGEVVVCGDLNVAHREIDLARPKENVGNAGFTDEERKCFGGLLDAGFRDSFRERYPEGGHYSWWSYQGQARARNIGWRIDYFLVTGGVLARMRDAFIWPEVTGSDHCPVGIDLEM